MVEDLGKLTARGIRSASTKLVRMWQEIAVRSWLRGRSSDTTEAAKELFAISVALLPRAIRGDMLSRAARSLAADGSIKARPADPVLSARIEAAEREAASGLLGKN